MSNLIWWPWIGAPTGGAPPVVAEYRPVGDNPEARAAREARKARRRIEQDEEELLFILSQL